MSRHASRKTVRRWFAAIALGLSVLVAATMPFGDLLTATANTDAVQPDDDQVLVKAEPTTHSLDGDEELEAEHGSSSDADSNTVTNLDGDDEVEPSSDATLEEEQEVVTDPAEQPEQTVEESEETITKPMMRGLNAPMSAPMQTFGMGSPDCNYADPGSGAYAQSLCWLDLDGFTTEFNRVTEERSCGFLGLLTERRYVYRSFLTNPINNYVFRTIEGAWKCSWSAPTPDTPNSVWTNGNRHFADITGYPISITLPGDHTLSATLSTVGSTNNASKAIAAKAFPTYPGAFLGNTTTGFYTGVAGKPALYSAIDGSAGNATGNTQLKLENVKLESSTGAVTKDFTIVVADAESTDGSGNNNRESITWSTTGAGFTWLPNSPLVTPQTQVSTMGNACGGGYTPALTTSSTSASCTAASTTVDPKIGTAMLQTKPGSGATFAVNQQLNYNTGGSKQGVAFGVIFARAEAEVIVKDRILDTAATATTADFNIKGFYGATELMNASTGSTALTATDTEGIPVVTGGNQLKFTSQATGAHSADYTVAWQCSKQNPQTGTSYWPGPAQAATSPTPPADAEPFTKLQAGEYLKCSAIYTPPYITVKKTVDNSPAGQNPPPNMINVAADWQLTALSSDSKATGVTETKKAVASGTYALSEAEPETLKWEFGYTWTDMQCVKNPDSTPIVAPDFDVTRNEISDAVETAEVTIAKGEDISCTYTNTANKPQLKVSKTSDKTARSAVASGETIEYSLVFDNLAGTVGINAGNTDYLADVLDDAELLNAAGNPIGTSGTPKIDVVTEPAAVGHSVQAVYNAADKKIVVSGGVPAYTKIILKYKVKVKANETDALERAAGNNSSSPKIKGYSLNNYLVEDDGGSLPNVCDEEDVTCVNHPVRAWTVEKKSQPLDGSAVHSGANNYFRVYVTNFSGEEIKNITLKDDMTSSLFAGIMDLNAPPAVTVPWGISFYNADGSRLAAGANDIVWNGVSGGTSNTGHTNPTLVFDGIPALNPDFPNASTGFDAGQPFQGTWTLNIPAFDMPADASYAIVGYAIKIGQIADPANGATPYLSGGSAPVVSAPNAFWVNTAAASKGTFPNSAEIEANRCRITDNMPGGWDEGLSEDENFGDCKTYHSLEESFFHLWKQGSDVVSEQNTQGNRLQGSTFILADTKADAEAGNPSRWLCRADNEVVPTGANGAFTHTDAPTAVAGSGTGAPAWEFESRQPGGVYDSMLQANVARTAYNNANPTTPVPLLEMCGLFYRHTAGADADGQSPGSWHAQDIRGGDDTDWRDENANGNGVYWVAEVKSPEDYQLLARPMQLWVAPSTPTPNHLFPGHREWYDYQGRLSLPAVGEGENPANADPAGVIPGSPDIRKQCVDPWTLPPNNQPMCIMPTGWTAPIFDAKLAPLPMAGGISSFWLGLAGGTSFAIVALTVWLFRRRKQLAYAAYTTRFNAKHVGAKEFVVSIALRDLMRMRR